MEALWALWAQLGGKAIEFVPGGRYFLSSYTGTVCRLVISTGDRGFEPVALERRKYIVQYTHCSLPALTSQQLDKNDQADITSIDYSTSKTSMSRSQSTANTPKSELMKMMPALGVHVDKKEGFPLEVVHDHLESSDIVDLLIEKGPENLRETLVSIKAGFKSTSASKRLLAQRAAR
jgi:hypothetical protein